MNGWRGAKMGMGVMTLFVVWGTGSVRAGAASDADCDENPAECTSCADDLVTCEADLAICEAAQTAFPATGQGPSTPPVPGEDGNPAYGAALSYQDNGDGTVTDLNTGLEWETKTNGGVRDVDAPYAWANAFAQHLPLLNNRCASDESEECTTDQDCVDAMVGGECGFGGHQDWRIPNLRELLSIADYGRFRPAIDPIFGPTTLAGYWSSTAHEDDPLTAWNVNFFEGNANPLNKSLELRVRAVRGGSLSQP